MIYVLQLKEDKFYVGYTKNLNGKRILSHFEGDGASFTKKYHPTRLLATFEGDKNYENHTTLIMMKEFGWQNVRGGIWACLQLLERPKELDALELLGAYKYGDNTENERCFFCNKLGHWAKDCDNKPWQNTGIAIKKTVKKEEEKSVPIKTDDKPLVLPEEKKNPLEGEKVNVKSMVCFNCGQPGHFARCCPLKIQKSIPKTRACFKCNKEGHFIKDCPLNKLILQGVSQEKKESEFVIKANSEGKSDVSFHYKLQHREFMYKKGFSQIAYKKVVCYYCGNEGHDAKHCPMDK